MKQLLDRGAVANASAAHYDGRAFLQATKSGQDVGVFE
jgi:hypothetical protein